MVEPEGLFTNQVGRGGTDQVTADQLLDQPAGVVPLALGTELADRPQVEDLSDHRGAPEQRALRVIQPIQTRGQQRLDRRRDRDPFEILRRDPTIALSSDHAVVHQHRHRLLGEQWIALGGLDDPRSRGTVDAADQVVDEPFGLLG